MKFHRITFAALALGLAVLGWLQIGQAASTIETTGQVLYSATDLSDTSFPTVNAKSATLQGTLFRLGGMPGKRYRGVVITPGGTGTATTTYAMRVYSVKRGFSAQGASQSVDYEYELVWSGTCTLGTTTGVATSGGFTSSHKFCDTISGAATSAYPTAMVAAFSGLAPSYFSPGSNGIARIFIPEMGNSDVVITVDMTGATSANFLIEGVN